MRYKSAVSERILNLIKQFLENRNIKKFPYILKNRNFEQKK